MAIEIDLRLHNGVKRTKKLEEHVQAKVGKLDRYLPDLQEAQVDLEVHTAARSAEDRHVAQITLRPRRGPLLRAEERSHEMLTAIDQAADKLNRQIERLKGKRNHRRGASPGATRVAEVLDDVSLGDDGGDDDDMGRIVREKRFPVVPMTADEALEQMQLLGHDNFFVFFNAEVGQVNVLYKRNDGSYGVIVPEPM